MGKEISTRGNSDNIIPTVIDKVTKTTGYDDFTESHLARLVAQDDASPIRNIMRASSLMKKLKGQRKSSMLILLAGLRLRHQEVEGTRGQSKSSRSQSCTRIVGVINNNNNHAGREFKGRLTGDQPPPLVCIRLGDYFLATTWSRTEHCARTSIKLEQQRALELDKLVKLELECPERDFECGDEAENY